jgi:hypothetical protein
LSDSDKKSLDEEVKAIRLISHSLLSSHSIPASPSLPPQNPQIHYTILHTQLAHLLSHNKPEWALEVAKAAVNLAPSEFITWAKLTEVYVELGQFEAALLTLNSCPMFTVNERDLHRMPTPARTSLPVRPWVEESGILEEGSSGDDVSIFLKSCLPSLILVIDRCGSPSSSCAITERDIRACLLYLSQACVAYRLGRVT